MGGETEVGWGGSTVNGKRTPVLGPGTKYPLIGHRRGFHFFPDPESMQNIQEEHFVPGEIA
jgi:hypothetical protein